MPRQNRVTPFGEIIATPARGTLMGNRGCLHNSVGQLRRAYQVERWIICLLEYKGWWRPVMQPGRYTELFFLDEVSALAAGHRPCALCQHERFELFRRMWASANPALAGSNQPSAAHLDARLHRERLTATRHKATYQARLDDLPAGSFVTLAANGPAYLVQANSLAEWQPEGYGPPIARPDQPEVTVLTPRSIVQTLAQGYPIELK